MSEEAFALRGDPRARFSAGLALLVWLGAAPVYAAEIPVTVSYDTSDVATQSCVAALKAATPKSGPVTPKLDFAPRQGGNRKDPLDRLVVSLEPDMDEDILAVPFAIRDIDHFRAYLASDIALRVAKSWYAMRPLATIAYGGFFQLFSRDAAATEPQHFTGREVGGAIHAQLYGQFKAVFGPLMLNSILSGDNYDDYAADAGKMRAERIDLMEAPLIDAPALGLAQSARFVNLTFSRVHAIYFVLRGNVDSLTTPARRQVVTWLQSAAEACSARNFDLEREALETLRRAGLTIAPVDRPAFAEAGWRWKLSLLGIDGRYWTMADLDELVLLKASAPPSRLPSTFLAALAPKAREEFLARDAEIAEGRRTQIADQESIEAAGAFDDKWATSRSAFTDGLRALPLAEADDGPRSVSRPALAALAKPIADLLEQELKSASPCSTIADADLRANCASELQGDWTAIAGARAAANDPAATVALRRAEELTADLSLRQRRHEADLKLARAAMALDGAVARQALDSYLTQRPDIERFDDGRPVVEHNDRDTRTEDRIRETLEASRAFDLLGDRKRAGELVDESAGLLATIGSPQYRASSGVHVASSLWLLGRKPEAVAMALDAFDNSSPEDGNLLAQFLALSPALAKDINPRLLTFEEQTANQLLAYSLADPADTADHRFAEVFYHAATLACDLERFDDALRFAATLKTILPRFGRDVQKSVIWYHAAILGQVPEGFAARGDLEKAQALAGDKLSASPDKMDKMLDDLIRREKRDVVIQKAAKSGDWGQALVDPKDFFSFAVAAWDAGRLDVIETIARKMAPADRRLMLSDLAERTLPSL
ncbi:MAG: hypothetical protein E7774_00945 [Bradyrhizobium sp.]|nr:MAG: hypothetical protein E7774_00945 [Bradyrhizobium sp.]